MFGKKTEENSNGENLKILSPCKSLDFSVT